MLNSGRNIGQKKCDYESKEIKHYRRHRKG